MICPFMSKPLPEDGAAFDRIVKQHCLGTHCAAFDKNQKAPPGEEHTWIKCRLMPEYGS